MRRSASLPSAAARRTVRIGDESLRRTDAAGSSSS